MTTTSLTTTEFPSTPAWQSPEHNLKLISPSVESKLVTSAIVWLFATLLLIHFCLCFYLNLAECFAPSFTLPLQDLHLLWTQLTTGNHYSLYVPFLHDNNKISICV